MAEALFHFSNLQGVSAGESIILKGPEAKHAISVRRIKPGEQIALGDGIGRIAKGKVTSTFNNELVLEVMDVEDFSKPKTELTLVQALAKGDRDELAVQAATELGVLSVIPWQADRSVSIWRGDKLEKGVKRWQAIADESTKQSLRPFAPIVAKALDSSELVPELKRFDLVIVLDPGASEGLIQANLDGKNSIAVVVGPEGGISEKELEAFNSADFGLFRLGPSVLRTSTAGLAAISFLQSRLGDWG